MTELLTAAQMRAIEAAAIESGQVTGLELMELAGRGVVEAMFEEWPGLAASPHRAVVLCGPGNNGGDGFVVARLLKDWGWEVDVVLYGDPVRLPPDARTNYQRWMASGEVVPLDAGFEPTCNSPAVVIDALFGTGLTRPVDGLGRVFLDLCDARGMGRGLPVADRVAVSPFVVAVDVPSGLCSDSGRVLRHADHADRMDHPGSPHGLGAAAPLCDLTVSFHARKLGHDLAEGPSVCGKVVVKDIGLKRGRDAAVVRRVDHPSGAAWLGKRSTHKFGHGHALVLSGGAGHTGAARLAARGALRIGAGLVTLGVPGSAQQEVAGQITALMLRRVDGAEALREVLADKRFNALCLGPGLGLERARDLVPVACAGGDPRPVVLDADALTAFADAPETLFGMLHDTCVLTPHGGEFARLFPDIGARLRQVPSRGPAFSKVDAAREAAARAGCVVLFKGPDTVIAAPDGRCAVHSAQYDRAAPWLATAGSGDVLAGFITGLLARGFTPLQAAKAATWLHVQCARRFGPGLIAEDLPEELPGVFRELGL